MRREDREMPSEWALEVMRKAPFVTMSLVSPDGMPYSVPLSMACTDSRTWYFHCAMEGRKIDILKQNPQVCLTAVSRCTPTVGPLNGEFTLQFHSAIAFGTAEIVEEWAEKTAALRAICERFLPHHMEAFGDAVGRSLDSTSVVRVRISSITGKRKQYDPEGKEMKYGMTD